MLRNRWNCGLDDVSGHQRDVSEMEESRHHWDVRVDDCTDFAAERNYPTSPSLMLTVDWCMELTEVVYGVFEPPQAGERPWPLRLDLVVGFLHEL